MSNPQLNVKSIFGRALELDSWDERNRYLSEACGHEASLRGEVEQLIDAVGRAGDFLGGEPAPAADESAAAIGTQIGPYKLLELIGEGGMGLVYKAEQQQPVKRQVALKIIKPGMDSRQVIARFEAERQALAAIMAEWTRTDQGFAQRVDHLANGGGRNTVDGGQTFFKLNHDTVNGDDAVDLLTGSAGKDWFVGLWDCGNEDRVTDASLLELLVDLLA